MDTRYPKQMLSKHVLYGNSGSSIHPYSISFPSCRPTETTTEVSKTMILKRFYFQEFLFSQKMEFLSPFRIVTVPSVFLNFHHCFQYISVGQKKKSAVLNLSKYFFTDLDSLRRNIYFSCCSIEILIPFLRTKNSVLVKSTLQK